MTFVYALSLSLVPWLPTDEIGTKKEQQNLLSIEAGNSRNGNLILITEGVAGSKANAIRDDFRLLLCVCSAGPITTFPSWKWRCTLTITVFSHASSWLIFMFAFGELMLSKQFPDHCSKWMLFKCLFLRLVTIQQQMDSIICWDLGHLESSFLKCHCLWLRLGGTNILSKWRSPLANKVGRVCWGPIR